MKLVLKIIVLLALAAATVGMLANPNDFLDIVDRELFEGAGIALIIAVWSFVLWLLFRAGKSGGVTGDEQGAK